MPKSVSSNSPEPLHMLVLLLQVDVRVGHRCHDQAARHHAAGAQHHACRAPHHTVIRADAHADRRALARRAGGGGRCLHCQPCDELRGAGPISALLCCHAGRRPKIGNKVEQGTRGQRFLGMAKRVGKNSGVSLGSEM